MPFWGSLALIGVGSVVIVFIGFRLWWPTRSNPLSRSEVGLALMTGGVIAFSILLLEVLVDHNARRAEDARQDRARLLSDLARGDLSRIDLHGKQLAGFYLRGKYLVQARLEDAHLDGANLEAALLQEANLSRAHLKESSLRLAHLESATLTGADLTLANLRSAFLNNARLNKAVLTGAHLEQAALRADLREATLSDARLQGADLRDADLRNAHLECSDLRWADLSGSDLRGAHFDDSGHPCLKGLSGANLGDCNAAPPSVPNLSFALYDVSTKWPRDRRLWASCLPEVKNRRACNPCRYQGRGQDHSLPIVLDDFRTTVNKILEHHKGNELWGWSEDPGDPFGVRYLFPRGGATESDAQPDAVFFAETQEVLRRGRLTKEGVENRAENPCAEALYFLSRQGYVGTPIRYRELVPLADGTHAWVRMFVYPDSDYGGPVQQVDLYYAKRGDESSDRPDYDNVYQFTAKAPADAFALHRDDFNVFFEAFGVPAANPVLRLDASSSKRGNVCGAVKD